MNKAEIILRTVHLENHLDALNKWRQQEYDAALRAHLELAHACGESKRLTTAIDTVEFEIELLKGYYKL
jgi:hypothetical protein